MVSCPSGTSIAQFSAVQYITVEDLENSERTIYLSDLWRFQPGDNLEWALPEYDDSEWEDVSTLLGANQLPFLDWSGIGWFRLHIDVDESLIGVPLALDVVAQSGASEMYVDGYLIFEFGHVSIDPAQEVSYQERKPRSIVFSESGIHVLAVRYSNHSAQRFLDSGYNAGFRYLFVEINHRVSGMLTSTRQITIHQFLFAGVLLVFTLIHLLLFLFYPKHHQNLYFALFSASFGVLNYLNYQTYFANSGQEIIALMESQFLFLVLTLIFFLMFCYSLFYSKIPKQFWGFVLVIILSGIFAVKTSSYSNYSIFQIIVLLYVIEIVRVLTVAVFLQKNGSIVFSAGMTIFIAAQLYMAGVTIEVLYPISGLSVDIAGIGGIIALLITMSVSMSRGFAQTNHRLETKLREVQVLSQKAIEQEREQKSRELDRLLLEADNKRKTQELEEARQLQLSMLPRDLPAVGNVEIGVRMKTATEVGGDYYDFSLAENGDLTVAIGDATGHGVKAGIVVATAKSYFKSFADECCNIDLLRAMSRGVKNMNLRAIYMTIALLKYSRNEIKLVGAGMPPALLYRSKTGEIETLLSKGMPLGSVLNYPYTELTSTVNDNDILILMSDGLPEAFNENRDILGLDPIYKTLKNNGQKSPEIILIELEKLVKKWTNGKELEDDYTIVIMKFHPKPD